MTTKTIMTPVEGANMLISRIGNGAKKEDIELFSKLPSGFNFHYPEEASSAVVLAFDLTEPANIMEIIWYASRPPKEMTLFWSQIFKGCRMFPQFLAQNGRPNLFLSADDKLLSPVLIYNLAGHLTAEVPDIRHLKKISPASGLRIFLRQKTFKHRF